MKPVYKLLIILTFTKLLFIIILLASHYVIKTNFLSILTGWDTAHFVNIATQGYAEPQLFAFMPIWPLIGHLFYKIGFPVWLGLLITANVISYLTVTCLYNFITNIWGQKIAWQATLLFIWAPTGWVLHLPYSDGLLILLMTLSLWSATNKNTNLSGIAIALSSLVKITGLTTFISLAIIQFQSSYKINKFILSMFISLSGIIIWSLCCYYSTGHLFIYITQQSIAWDRHFIPYPGYIALTTWQLIALYQVQSTDLNILSFLLSYLPEITDLVIGIFTFAIIILYRNKLPTPLHFYVLIYLFIVTSSPQLDFDKYPFSTAPQLGVTRYIWTCWLVFIPLTIWANKNFSKLLYTSITLYILYAVPPFINEVHHFRRNLDKI